MKKFKVMIHNRDHCSLVIYNLQVAGYDVSGVVGLEDIISFVYAEENGHIEYDTAPFRDLRNRDYFNKYPSYILHTEGTNHTFIPEYVQLKPDIEARKHAELIEISASIYAIMERFDFGAVAKCMKCLAREWEVGQGDRTATPDEDEIQQQARARKLMIECYAEGKLYGKNMDNFDYTLVNGGFEAKMYKHTSHQGKVTYDMSLKFVIEQRHSCSLLASVRS